MKKPGILLLLPDGRKTIVYNEQPLLQSNGRVILNLIDEKLNLIYKDGKPSIIMKSVEQYNLENQEGVNKIIGFVD